MALKQAIKTEFEISEQPSEYSAAQIPKDLRSNDKTDIRKRRPFCARIAMVCDFFYPRLGGVENHIWSLSQQLLRLGHKVIVITHAYGNRKGVRYLGNETDFSSINFRPLKVYYCPFVPMTDQDALPTFLTTLPLLRCIFIRERIQIVHAHQATSTMANESLVYASMLNLASVYTDHSLFSLNDVGSVVLNSVLKTTLLTAQAAICVSNTCRDNLILRAHLDPTRVRVIPNAVDPSAFTPTVTDSDNHEKGLQTKRTVTFDIDGTKRSRIRIIVISRLVFRKGVDLLVAIIPNLCRELDHVDFIIGGDGTMLLNVQEMVERERLQDRVQLIGAIPHAQVRDVLVTGHIFLNCSLTESFCIAVVEAACCGLRVVSTNVGGLPEVLPRDIMLLGEPNVPEMLATLKHAIYLQSDPATALDPMQTHERVKSMYSWRRVALETTLVYESVLNRQKTHHNTLCKRIHCYRQLGIISGLVICWAALTMQIWLRFVIWWQPSAQIDIVPDLSGHLDETTKDDEDPVVNDFKMSIDSRNN